MTINEDKTSDSLTFTQVNAKPKPHYNIGKIYNKSQVKKKIVKYFTCSEAIHNQLKVKSEATGYSMAKIIEDSLKLYLK